MVDQDNNFGAHPLIRRLPFHYGWAVVAAGCLALFACIGMGRFALGMLLPSMGHSLSLSRAEMGWISTTNFIGYMIAVLSAGRLVGRLGARRTIVLGLTAVALSMAAVSRAADSVQIAALYLLTGLGSGTANVPVMGLVAHWFGRQMRGRAAGFMVIGSGFAIMAAGALIPAINAAHGTDGWRVSWAVIALIVAGAALIDLLVLRNHPAELGLAPVTGTAHALGAHSSPHCAAAPTPATRRRVLAHLGLVYAAFGFSYVIYATFIVTALVQERGFSESAAGLFWSWIGLLSLASGPVFGGLSDRIGRRGGLMMVFACQATAYGLAALPLPEPFLYASIVLFGVTVWAVPSIMAAAVGDYLGPDQAAGAFGTITVFFALGQITGPAAAGRLADSLGGFSAGFTLAAAAAGLGVLSAALLPNPRKNT